MEKVKKGVSVILASAGIACIAIFVWKYVYSKLGIENYINVDDLCSIQFAMTGGNSIVQKLKGIIIQDPTNVPLFYVLLWIMTSVGGFDPNVMRYLPELIAAMAIVVMAFIGYKNKGKKGALLMVAFSITSIQVIYAAFQLRAYSLLILNAALLMLTWQYREKNRWCQILYLITLWLLSFSHFFGVLLCFAFGLWDLISVISKKKPFKILIVYIIYCVLYVPYLAVSFYLASEMWGNFWPPVPDYYDAVQMIYQLSPGHIIGFAIFIYVVISNIVNRKQKEEKAEIKNLAMFAVFIVIGIGFVYSRYLKPESSIWVYRYFLVLFPCVLYVVVDCVVDALTRIANALKMTGNEKKTLILALAVMMMFINFDYSMNNKNEINTGGCEFGAVKEFINHNEDIKNDNTVVFFPYPEQYFEGWIQFMTEGNANETPNIVCTYDELNQYDMSQIDTIYAVGWVYDVFDCGMNKMEQFSVAEENCDGLSDVYRFEKISEETN